MAFMDSVRKGLTTIDVKTSNFMEENKLKTGIATKESEITQMKMAIGNLVYEHKDEFSQEYLQELLSGIEERSIAIASLKREIESLAEKERDILGQASVPQAAMDTTPKIFCSNCGSPNGTGYKFCEKCGSPLVLG